MLYMIWTKRHRFGWDTLKLSVQQWKYKKRGKYAILHETRFGLHICDRPREKDKLVLIDLIIEPKIAK